MLTEYFLRQAEVCGKQSVLCQDILLVLGKEDKVLTFLEPILDKREFSNYVQPVLLILAFFHYHSLKNHKSPLRNLYSSLGGNYNSKMIKNLKANLLNIFDSEKAEIEKWLLTKILQTNEIGRAKVIYPTILSLNKPKINLIELGCSAGLLLFMDKFNYNYNSKTGSFSLDNNHSDFYLECLINNNIDKDIFNSKTKIINRVGLDLNIINLKEKDNHFFLESSIWDETKRSKLLNHGIGIFQKYQNEVNLFQYDYTKDFYNLFSNKLNFENDFVFYTSASTYQLDNITYEKLIKNLKSFASKIKKTITLIEFESPREKPLTEEINPNESFLISITDFPSGEKKKFASAHHHGISMTLY